MQAQVVREVLEAFSGELADRYPGFSPVGPTAAGSPVWAASIPGFSCFLVFQPNQKRSGFTLEVAWSLSGEYPNRGGQYTPYLNGDSRLNIPPATPVDGGLRGRLNGLITLEDDLWWNLASGKLEPFQRIPSDGAKKPTKANVSACVADASEKVGTLALEYFDRCCRDYCGTQQAIQLAAAIRAATPEEVQDRETPAKKAKGTRAKSTTPKDSGTKGSPMKRATGGGKRSTKRRASDSRSRRG